MTTPKGSPPPAAFKSSDIVTTALAPGLSLKRLYLSKYPDPLGFGPGVSRFSDPDPTTLDPFSVVYFGTSIKVCFLEAVLRDRGDGRLGS